MFKVFKWFLIAMSVILITACGGGGGGTPPPKDPPPVAGKVTITLTGASSMTLEVKSSYAEPGATAYSTADSKAISVNITGAVDIAKLGTYTIYYTVVDSKGNTDSKQRSVKVIDSTKPTITLKDSATIVCEAGQTCTDPKAVLHDNYDPDKDISALNFSIVKTDTIGTYAVKYGGTDTSGNKAVEVTRTVNIKDTIAPVITLNNGPIGAIRL